MSELSDKFEEFLEKTVNKYVGEVDTDDTVMKDKVPELYKIANTVVKELGDGIQLSDVLTLGKLVPDVMNVADTISGMSSEDKHAFVTDAMWLIYKAIDTGPDGNQNRINVPYLFGGLETKFEKIIVNIAAGFAIKSARALVKSKDSNT